jgi:hypothetical protein
MSVWIEFSDRSREMARYEDKDIDKSERRTYGYALAPSGFLVVYEQRHTLKRGVPVESGTYQELALYNASAWFSVHGSRIDP